MSEVNKKKSIREVREIEETNEYKWSEPNQDENFEPFFFDADIDLGQYIFSVSRVICGLSRGTGFFFQSNQQVFLVTNKHVIFDDENETFFDSKVHAYIFEELDNKKCRSVKIEFDIRHKGTVYDHPNKDTDIVALDFNFVSTPKRNLKLTPLGPQHILSDEKMTAFSYSSDVYMFGYPIGLYDKKTNLPLIRKGITTFHPSTDVDYDGKKNSLGAVDLYVIGGSSGSPIFLAPRIQTNKGTLQILNREVFVGLLAFGPLVDSKPINVGYYEKAKQLLEIQSWRNTQEY